MLSKASPERAAALLLFVYPILLLTVRHGTNICFALLIVVSIVHLWQARANAGRDPDGRAVALYCAAMISLSGAVLLNQIYHWQFKLGAFDGPSRFWLAIPIFFALRTMPGETFALLPYGFAFGALAAALRAVAGNPWALDSWYFVNVIHYGDQALMLGVLALLSIRWTREPSRPLLALGWTACAAGVAVSIGSGSRGGWIAMPVLFAVWLYDRRAWLSPAPMAAASVIFALAIVAGYLLVPIVHHRIDAIFTDLTLSAHGNPDTSVGLRLQIWKAAILLFAHDPVLGIAAGEAKALLMHMQDRGVITELGVTYALAEVHNEMLARLAYLGIAGFLAILSVYAVPLALFVRVARSAPAFQSQAGILGIALVAGYFVFGLTVEIFSLKTTVTFYSMTVAVLLAAAMHRDSMQDLPKISRSADR